MLDKSPSFREFWAHYLLHHQHPMTRLWHSIGSVICIVGVVTGLVLGSIWPVIGALFVGYLCAFTGHWWIERNRPLTFQYPILAGICNWRLFAVECRALFGFGSFQKVLAAALALAPALGCRDIDPGAQ